MLKKPRLRSHLCLDVAEPDLVVVRSEDDSSVFEGRILPLLAAYLDGEHTVADIAERLAGQASVVDVRFGLSLLEEKGYLIDESGDERLPEATAVFRDALDLDPADFRRRLADTRVEVLGLGSLRPEPLVAILESLGLRTAAGGGDVLVVLAEDYLEDRLAEIDRRELSSGRSWLLVKPLGLVPWIGPLFKPAETGCWACLARRLEQNRPFHELPAPSRATLPSTLELSLQAAASQVLRWVGAGSNPRLLGRLLALDSRTLKSTEHQLVRQPDCSHCGSPRSPERSPEPVRLREARRTFFTDGGFRTLSPDETCRRLEHHISPITGVIGRLDDYGTNSSGSVQGALRVYVAEHVFRSHDRREALLTRQRQKSAGKGLSDDQARASALCEALERYSGVYRGDEPRRRARFVDLGEEAIHPSVCLTYSAAQYRDRETWNLQPSRFAWVAMPFDEEKEIDWSPLWSLTDHRVKYLPTAYCYFGVPLPGDHRFCISDSNGNAAGNCLEEAIFQGYLELVERDAVGVWWANRLPRPAVLLESFERADFAALQALYREMEREFHVLDLTHDFTVPVFAAVSWEASASPPIAPLLGFGAHFDAEIAIGRALTEMNQFLPGLATGREGRVLSGPVPDVTYLRPSADAEIRTRDHYPRVERGGDLREEVLRAVDLARGCGLETLVLDQTRGDVGLSVVKVVVPGLRHYWPRWGPGRLYDVPVAMGWLPEPRPEDELNPVHILI